MIRRLAAATLACLAALVFIAPAPAKADIQHDICAVLKSRFDNTGLMYFTFDTSYETILIQPSNDEYALVKCLFLPKRSPNYGNLCQQALFRIFPTQGGIYTSDVVPMLKQDGSLHPYCPR